MASHLNSDPNSSPTDPALAQGPGTEPTPSAPAAPERFTLPTSSRAGSAAPQVLAAPAAVAPAALPQSAAEAEAEAAAIAGVRQREAKARLLAIRRIEWVAIALVTVLLGGAAWSWRSRSDAIEKRLESFRSSPIPLNRGAGPRRRPAVPLWRAAQPGEVKAASQAIRGQLDAFKRDDYAAAAVWQSRSLRQRFGTVSAFRRAIRENYPAFTAYKGVRFGVAESLRDGAALRIKAVLQGPSDEPIPAEYFLVRESGAWRIDGVSAPAARGPEEALPPSPPAEAA